MLLLPAVALTVVPVTVAAVAAGRPSRPDVAVRRATAPLSPELSASRVLGTWDRRRATAWSRGDPAALADLYTARSRTGARDVANLRRWRRRGFRVVGLREQVAELHVRGATTRGLVLRVTDRTVGGVALGGGRRTALPSSAWATHRIRLVRRRGRWRVVEVVPQPAR
jgi:hypothetical protein